MYVANLCKFRYWQVRCVKKHNAYTNNKTTPTFPNLVLFLFFSLILHASFGTIEWFWKWLRHNMNAEPNHYEQMHFVDEKLEWLSLDSG